jgi:hypothetical protein
MEGERVWMGKFAGTQTDWTTIAETRSGNQTPGVSQRGLGCNSGAGHGGVVFLSFSSC